MVNGTDWHKWKGKRVFIKLYSGKVFTNSIITDIIEEDNLVRIELKDKYKKDASIESRQIAIIQEDIG